VRRPVDLLDGAEAGAVGGCQGGGILFINGLGGLRHERADRCDRVPGQARACGDAHASAHVVVLQVHGRTRRSRGMPASPCSWCPNLPSEARADSRCAFADAEMGAGLSVIPCCVRLAGHRGKWC
jgi:hypothetical protein